MVINNLLGLRLISHITLLVKPTRLESRATHAPAAPYNQYHLNLILRWLTSNIALYQIDEPVTWNFLNYQVFAKIIVPHVTRVTVKLACFSTWLYRRLGLQRSC